LITVPVCIAIAPASFIGVTCPDVGHTHDRFGHNPAH
jgi:hypothetical protein